MAECGSFIRILLRIVYVATNSKCELGLGHADRDHPGFLWEWFAGAVECATAQAITRSLAKRDKGSVGGAQSVLIDAVQLLMAGNRSVVCQNSGRSGQDSRQLDGCFGFLRKGVSVIWAF